MTSILCNLMRLVAIGRGPDCDSGCLVKRMVFFSFRAQLMG